MMAQLGPRAGYCPHGCYWDCEHRGQARSATPLRARRDTAVGTDHSRPGDPTTRRRGWALGPGTGDDPEQAALDEWRLHSIAGIPFDQGPVRDVPVLKFCSDCGRSFSDATAHSREHERTRQLRRGDEGD